MKSITFQIITGLVCISLSFGCVSNSISQTPNIPAQTNATTKEGQYVALPHPISLHPIITSSLNKELANSSTNNELNFDSDLLSLSSSVTKSYTKQISGDAGAKFGLVNLSADYSHFRTTFDTVQYASYDLDIDLPLKGSDGFESVKVVPIIGTGVRIIADYLSKGGTTSFAMLSGEGIAKAGSLELQLLGINRLGPNTEGIGQLNLTPDSISMLQQQVASIMAQLWLKDTIVQPKVVGYYIPGDYPMLDTRVGTVLRELLDNTMALSSLFFESQLQELLQIKMLNYDRIDDYRKTFEEEMRQVITNDERDMISKLLFYKLNGSGGGNLWINDKIEFWKKYHTAVKKMPDRLSCLTDDELVNLLNSLTPSKVDEMVSFVCE